MIRKIRIQGFKSLPDVELELGRINVFIGANGSGKSNILEAIGILGAAASGSVESESIRYRGVRLGTPALYKSSFIGKRFRTVITLEACWKNRGIDSSYKVSLFNPIEKPTEEWEFQTETLKSGDLVFLTRNPKTCYVASGTRKKGEKEYTPPLKINDKDKFSGLARLSTSYFMSSSMEDIEGEKVIRIDLHSLSADRMLKLLEKYAIYTPTTSVLRGTAEDKITRAPLGLSGGGLPIAVKTLLGKKGSFGPFDLDEVLELIGWAEDINVVPTFQIPIFPSVPIGQINLRFRDRYMREGRNTLSAYDASEGALYVLFMLALIAHPESPGFLAVDNFDHSIHPRLIRKLTEMICEYVVEEGKRQILLTTHNPLALDGLDITDDEIRLFAVDRNSESGFTQVRRVELSEKLWKEAQEKGLSLSRLWTMGRLGGVPQNLF